MHEATRGGMDFLPKPPDNRPEAPVEGAARRRRGRPRVLMANEPRAYREGIAAVIGQLRPEVEVETVEPRRPRLLHRAPLPRHGHLQQGHRDALKGGVRVWVELYPDNDALSVANIGGRRMEYAEIQLPDLLSIVDKAEELAGTN